MSAPKLPSASIVDRPRLDSVLDEIAGRRLTLVIGGAGYGKSTLVRAWAAGRRVAWVGLRDDPAAAGSLVGAILRAVGQAGVALEAHLEPSLGAAATTDAGLGVAAPRRAEALATVLAAALEAADLAELTLVFDDFHELRAAGDTALVAGLIRQAPSTLHTVLISRSSPGFPVERLRARGELLEIGVPDLALDAEETSRVVASAFGSAADGLARRLMETTGGWPALTRLLVESLRHVPAADREGAIARALASGDAVFPYLAEEVFGAESEDIRELVRTIAPLDAFDLELVTALGVSRAATSLVALRSRGLFIAAAPDRPDRLTLHALIREFALRRLPLAPDRLREVRASAVRWLIATGEPEAALRSAALARDPVLVRDVLREHGAALVRRGRVDGVIEAAAGLRVEDRDAELALIIGDASAHRGEQREAEAAYRSAAVDGRLPASAAWRLGKLAFERREIDEAARIVAEASLDGGAPADRARLLAWRAFCAWYTADPEAHLIARQAIEAAIAAADPGARAAAETAASYATLTSDLPASAAHHRAALRAAQEAGDVIAEIRLGNAGEAGWSVQQQLDEVLRVLPLAEAAGNPLWLSRTLVSSGLLWLDLGRLDAAETDLRRALDVDAEMERADPSARIFLAELHRMRGDIVLATAEYEAIGRRELDGDSMAVVKGGHARVLARTDPDRASALVRGALDLVLPHHRQDVLLAAGWVALCQGRADDAAAIAAEVIGIAAADEALVAALGHGLSLAAMAASDPAARRTRLEQSLAIWQRIGNLTEAAAVELALGWQEAGRPGRLRRDRARSQLGAAGIRASAADGASLLAVLPVEHAPAVEIRALGGFVVRRHGDPVPIPEWKSKKPRDLLKLLLARRGPISRDELIDTLWPDEPPSATSSRLSVNLSILRAVLDPAHARAADTFVATDGDSLRLVLDELVVDHEEFVAMAREGLALQRRGRAGDALERLVAAEALYTGDLFEEDPYADWAVAPREEARALYVQVARATAELLAGAGDDDGAARYLRRILERDPFDEPAHLDLVRCLGRARHHGEARRAYTNYVARTTELGIEPAAYP